MQTGAAAKSNSKSLNDVLSLVTVVIGTVLIGFSTPLVLSNARHSKLTLLDDFVGQWVMWAPIAIGIALVLLGCLGCFTDLGDWWTLSAFGPLQLASGMVVIASGAAVIAFLHDVLIVATNDAWSVSGSPMQESVNDYTTGFFGACCVAGPESMNVSECSPSNIEIDSYCYFDEAMFDAGASASSEMCEKFESFCNSSASESERGQRLKDLQGNFHAVMEQYAKPTAVVLSAAGVLLVVLAVGSCLCLCHKSARESQPSDKNKTWRSGKPPLDSDEPPLDSGEPPLDSNGVQNV